MENLNWRCPDCGAIVDYNNTGWEFPKHDCYMKHLHKKMAKKKNRKKNNLL